ncbi:hypothetical protein IQ07DRAFT_587606 [Pyrenochaeta sp. DS3sAY3a]|nr:hypothetical protein IQ07DRAFT_587606 [Pyrenochaeta sp. DS3sAY3a]
MSDPNPQMPALPPFDASNSKTYHASCHCAGVQYTVLLSPPLADWKVVSCNCSICSRNAYLLVYPSRPQLQITRGEELLRDYSFASKRNLHKFCARCGSAVFFDPRMREFGGEEEGLDLLGVNVRMFRGVNVKELDVVYIEDPHPDGSENAQGS